MPSVYFVVSLLVLIFCVGVSAEENKGVNFIPGKRNFFQEENGTIHVPSFELPLSPHLSSKARDFLKQKDSYGCGYGQDPDVNAVRKCVDDKVKVKLDEVLSVYKVDVQKTQRNGVNTYTVTPKNGIAPGMEDKVLVYNPGSGFQLNTHLSAQLGAAPMAALAGIKVIGVDYRKAPEYKHPAAAEDVVAVYRELLDDYKPENIGMYGCSAGGRLTAQTMTMLIKEKLPLPGAIAMTGAAATGSIAGNKAIFMAPDSYYISYAINGFSTNKEFFSGIKDVYQNEGDHLDPSFFPGRSDEVMRNFPPSLLVSSTRDRLLSEIITTHRQLTRLGVPADLQLWEGFDHCFYVGGINFPESREVYDVMVKFFNKHLN